VTEVEAEQRKVCARFHAAFSPPDPSAAFGLAWPLDPDAPLCGLRHPPEAEACGWFVWSGEYSDEDEFFEPVEVAAAGDLVRRALPYLALPPGWRFLLAPGYEDVWFDATLLMLPAND
jgi:hypothetical protein